MNFSTHFVFYIVIGSFLLSCSNSEKSDNIENDNLTRVERQVVNANWTSTEVTKYVTWKYFHFDSLYDAKQFVTVIDVNLNSDVVVDIPYVKEGFMKTSEAAINSRAFAAVNGSFFDTKIGGSTVFLRHNDEVVNETRTGFNPFRENAGFAVKEWGDISIVKRPSDDEGGWVSVEAKTLLASGPLLIYEGIQLNQESNSFNNNRHPRTAAGVTKDNHLILLVVDGRSSDSHGMSINELSEFMHALGCVEAMNLDGGGSSTAWVNGEGVVNHPSDNKLFDNDGERGVANAIVVK